MLLRLPNPAVPVRPRALRLLAPAVALPLAAGGCADPLAPADRDGRLYVSGTNLVLAAGDTTSLGLALETPGRRGGRDYRFTAPAGFGESWPADRPVTWNTTDSAVATVSPAGLVTARGAGRVVLVAASGALRDTVTLTVHAARPEAAAFTAVAVGAAHACGLAAGGAVFCWGSAWHGEVGQGAVRRFTPVLAPAPVASAARYTALAAGSNHTCALTAAGRAHCWGDARFGQTGAGDADVHPAPTPAAGTRTFTALSARADQTCGLTPGGRVVCWGGRADGRTEFAPPTAGAAAGRPAAAFVAVAAGADHRCALTADGAAFCWGANAAGQLGTGDARARSEPAPVADGHRFRQIAAGVEHTCGVRPDGVALCWGRGWNGRLGVGPVAGAALVPTPVAGGHRFVAVAAATEHTCALTADGAAYCWGQDLRGALGDGPPARPDPSASDLIQWSPVRVTGAPAWRALAAGAEATCGVTAHDRAYCWGNNANGALGVGAKGWSSGQWRSVRETPAPVVAPPAFP